MNTSNEEAKIYHFTTLETAIEYILPSMKLRSNNLSHMNDPKEAEPWVFSGLNIDYESIYPNTYNDDTHIDHQFLLGKEIKSRIQALCFVHSNNEAGYKNEMMWAHYSRNHTSVCLELNEKRFCEDNKENIKYFEEINYNSKESASIYWDKSKSKEENYLLFIENYRNQLYLSKSHYWEKESEKRVISISKEHVFFDIKNSLTGIYYGLNSKAAYRPSIEQFLDKSQTIQYDVYFERLEMKRSKIEYGDFRDFIKKIYK